MNAPFSERLRSAIARDGRSKSAIAAAVGVHGPALSRWLRGAIPETRHLVKLADTLNVGVQWLASGDLSESPEFQPGRMRETPAPYHLTTRPASRDELAEELLLKCHAVLDTFEHVENAASFDFALKSLNAALATYRRHLNL